GVIVPNFLIAALLQLWVGVYLGWLPAGGWPGFSIAHLILPVIVLAWPHAARISRLMRGSMIEILGTNYVRTAKSKGIGERLVLARHAIKPALLPVVSYLGPGLSYLLTGSLVVEQVFGLPGIGRYFISAALARDYGIVLGTTVLYVGIIIVLNLIVDIVYAWLDPKVRSNRCPVFPRATTSSTTTQSAWKARRRAVRWDRTPSAGCGPTRRRWSRSSSSWRSSSSRWSAPISFRGAIARSIGAIS